MTVEELISMLAYMLDEEQCEPDDMVVVYEPEGEHWGELLGAYFGVGDELNNPHTKIVYLSAKEPEGDKVPHHLHIIR
jgi:hypothetical protein